MAMFYRSRFGASWPNNGLGGGFGHYGITSLDAKWDTATLLSPTIAPVRFQPRIGGPRVTLAVPPTITPCLCWTMYAYNDVTPSQTYGTGGSGYAWRIFVTPPGGSECLLYSVGNPIQFTWTGSEWSASTDTGSVYYLVTPGTVPAGWTTYPAAAYTANVCDPENLGTKIQSLFVELVKNTPWDVGLWSVRWWCHTTQGTAGFTDPQVPPETWQEEESWTFTVAETCAPLDAFVERNAHWRRHR